MTTHNAVAPFLLSEAPPLYTCLGPFSAFSPLSFLMALTVVFQPFAYTFCLPACEWVNWGRKWANAFNCQSHASCFPCALRSPNTFTWNIKNIHVSNQGCVKCDCWHKGRGGGLGKPRFPFKLPPVQKQSHFFSLFGTSMIFDMIHSWDDQC